MILIFGVSYFIPCANFSVLGEALMKEQLVKLYFFVFSLFHSLIYFMVTIILLLVFPAV